MRMHMINASLHSGVIRRVYHTEVFTGLMGLNVLCRERSVAIHMLRRRYPEVPEEAYSQPVRPQLHIYLLLLTERAAGLVQREWRRSRAQRAVRRYINLVRRLAMFRHTPQLIGNHDVLSMIIRLFGESL